MAADVQACLAFMVRFALFIVCKAKKHLYFYINIFTGRRFCVSNATRPACKTLCAICNMTFRLIILTLISLKLRTTAQNSYKLFSDSLFKIGDKIICQTIYFDVGNGFFIDKKDLGPLAEISTFLKRHPKFQIEIGVYSDDQGKSDVLKSITSNRALSIKDNLVNEFQMDSTRIKSFGYGNSFFIIPDSIIRASKTKSERDSLRSINRRTEVKILSTN